MAQLTNFGKDIKHRLVDIDRNQAWLIEQVKEKTGLYFDSGYLWKVMVGDLETPKVVEAIKEVLSI